MPAAKKAKAPETVAKTKIKPAKKEAAETIKAMKVTKAVKAVKVAKVVAKVANVEKVTKVVKPIAKDASKKVAAKQATTKKAAVVVTPKPVKKAEATAVKSTKTSKHGKLTSSAPPVPAASLPASAAAAPVPTKKRAKGADKHYVAPPTVVAVKNTAKLHHLPPAQASAMDVPIVPALIKRNPKLANNWKDKDPQALSDAEVIAMPDVEYMNEVQLAFFRHKLVQLQTQILSKASETTEHIRDDTVVVPDPTDRATIEEEHALELRTRDRERKLLKKIEQSIARIDQGDYGYCEETGEPIGVARLIARPTASLSLEAQQRRELKQRMFGE